MKKNYLMSKQKAPLCPVHKMPMLMMYGAGWDYDRWVCAVGRCYEEVELDTTTIPEDYKSGKVREQESSKSS